jgi:acetyltransferase-like isoleucine patch superfamily enzyme
MIPSDYLARLVLHLLDDLKKRKRISNKKIKMAKSAEVLVSVNLICEDGGTIEIDEGCFINDFCSISACGNSIKIGKDVLVGPGTVMHTVRHHFERTDIPIWRQGRDEKPIVIGDDVWIGAHVTVLGGVTIGAHSVIGANSLVNKNIPPYSVAYGVPCKVRRNRKKSLSN